MRLELLNLLRYPLLKRGTILREEGVNHDYVILSPIINRYCNHDLLDDHTYLALTVVENDELRFNISSLGILSLSYSDIKSRFRIQKHSRRKLLENTIDGKANTTSDAYIGYSDAYIGYYGIFIELNSQYCLEIVSNPSSTLFITKKYDKYRILNIIDKRVVIDIMLQATLQSCTYLSLNNIKNAYYKSKSHAMSKLIEDYIGINNTIMDIIISRLACCLLKLRNTAEMFPNEYNEVISSQRWQLNISKHDFLSKVIPNKSQPITLPLCVNKS